MDEMTILVVDDQRETLDLIEEALSGNGRRVLTFDDPVQALKAQEERWVDLVLTDLRMPQMNGLEVLSTIKARSPETEVILLTAYGDIELAVQAMKQGAADFFSKPIRVAELTGVVSKVLELQSMRRRLKDLTGGDVAPVGTGETMQRVLALARAVGETDSTVLILGETGVGKEILANYIQRQSPRANGPFVKVNCAALPETLLESELFGHEKGAFTGAADRHVGRFERANRGTLFLDEIAEMPLSMQVRFLRVLQEREIERIGGSQSIPVDFRLICATHRRLEQLVADGKFREDLYYRINVFPIHLPALRQRLEDIPALTHHFLKRAHGKIGRGPLEIAPQALALLQQHAWPGNVRELENVIERACVLAQGPTLLPDHLTWWGQFRPVAADAAGVPASQPLPTPPLPVGPVPGDGGSSSIARVSSSSVLPAVAPPNDGNGHPPADATGIDWDLDAENPLEEAERATLKRVLERCQWNFKKAAERLKLSRSTLYAKVSRYGLQRE